MLVLFFILSFYNATIDPSPMLPEALALITQDIFSLFGFLINLNNPRCGRIVSLLSVRQRLSSLRCPFPLGVSILIALLCGNIGTTHEGALIKEFRACVVASHHLMLLLLLKHILYLI